MKNLSKTTYPQKPLIAVVGPTASGKSDLAVKLAQKFNGEIISADSRQVYRGMDIGTGKITKKEMRDVAHHLLDVASPRRRFSVAQYKKLGQAAIRNIRSKNKLPIICGGTGFYIRALIDDLAIPTAKPDFKLRAKLEKKTNEELFKELKKLDPRRAKNIDCHNPRRLIRALEIIYQTGQPVPKLNPPQSSFTKKGSVPPFRKGRLGGMYNNVLFLGIQIPRPKLAKRIKIRLQKRLKQGMIAEVKKLRKQGLSWKKLEDFGLEYRWLAIFLKQKTLRQAQVITYDEMIFRLQKDIEHYAKRQLTWFGQDKRVIWIKYGAQAIKKIRAFLS